MTVVAVALAACAAPSSPTAQSALTRQATKVSLPTVTYIVPNDPAVLNPPGSIGRIVFTAWTRGTDAKRELLRFDLSSDAGFVERRTDNGVAGSGKRYTVVKSQEAGAETTILKFTATDYVVYQQGLVLPFAVPMFTEADVQGVFLSGQLHAKFEVDSEFNPESTYANFVRLLKNRSYRNGEHDPVTGKIFKQEFSTTIRGKDVYLVVETFPYRNGSKTVIYARVPAVETSPNTVDFRVLLQETKVRLAEVAKA